MVRLYVSRFESAFHVLHVPSFWTEYTSYWTDPVGSPNALRFKVQLVMALSSNLYQGTDAVQIRSAVHQWVYTAQDWLSGPLKKDRLSIDALQVHCLQILARQCLSVAGDLVWIAVGTLLRTAMQMSLHRDPTRFTKIGLLYVVLALVI